MRLKKVIHKRIPPKEKAVGLAYNDRRNDPPNKVGTIEIEKRQSALNILDTEIHEFIHMKYPEIPEESAKKMATMIANFWLINIWNIE